MSYPAHVPQYAVSAGLSLHGNLVVLMPQQIAHRNAGALDQFSDDEDVGALPSTAPVAWLPPPAALSLQRAAPDQPAIAVAPASLPPPAAAPQPQPPLQNQQVMPQHQAATPQQPAPAKPMAFDPLKRSAQPRPAASAPTEHPGAGPSTSGRPAAGADTASAGGGGSGLKFNPLPPRRAAATASAAAPKPAAKPSPEVGQLTDDLSALLEEWSKVRPRRLRGRADRFCERRRHCNLLHHSHALSSTFCRPNPSGNAGP